MENEIKCIIEQLERIKREYSNIEIDNCLYINDSIVSLKHVLHNIRGNLDEYLDNIEQLSRKYNISISHEDGHGAFIFEQYNEDNIKWLRDGYNYTKKEQE